MYEGWYLRRNVLQCFTESIVREYGEKELHVIIVTLHVIAFLHQRKRLILQVMCLKSILIT